MSKELADLQDIKSAFISHCKELGCGKNYIKFYENKFSNVETALKKKNKIDPIDEKVVVDISTPEGFIFYKDMEKEEITLLEKLNWLIDRSKLSTKDAETQDIFNAWGCDIEKALIEQENTDKTINELFSDNGKVITTIEIKNKLKALKTLKDELGFDRQSFFVEIDEKGNKKHYFEGREIAKDKYDLLKEVLL